MQSKVWSEFIDDGFRYTNTLKITPCSFLKINTNSYCHSTNNGKKNFSQLLTSFFLGTLHLAKLFKCTCLYIYVCVHKNINSTNWMRLKRMKCIGQRYSLSLYLLGYGLPSLFLGTYPTSLKPSKSSIKLLSTQFPIPGLAVHSAACCF